MVICEIVFDAERKAIVKDSDATNLLSVWKKEKQPSDRMLVQMSGRSYRSPLRGKNRNIFVTLCDLSIPYGKSKKLFSFTILYNDYASLSPEIKGKSEDQFYRTNRPLEEILEAIVAADKYYSTAIFAVNYKQPFHLNKPLMDTLLQQIKIRKVPIP
jgi:hypothetical protein